MYFLCSKIEDKTAFTQAYLINLMKMIPPSAFRRDDVQRILRFVKQHEGIPERDYLEAVEMAGHVLLD
jgi:hypothetical protein